MAVNGDLMTYSDIALNPLMEARKAVATLLGSFLGHPLSVQLTVPLLTTKDKQSIMVKWNPNTCHA